MTNDSTSGAAFFDSMYKDEHEPWSFSGRAAEILRHEWIAETMAQLDPMPRRTLDVGCSLGQLTARLAYALPDVYGVDVSATAVAHASRRVPPRAASFVAGSATELPIASRTVDLAVASDGLYSWNLPPSDRCDALREMHRVLKPGGLVLLTEHTRAERFTELVNEVTASPLRVLSVTYLYDRPWYQFESWLRAVQSNPIARALRRNVSIARALRRVGRMIGPRASRHICILAIRDSD